MLCGPAGLAVFSCGIRLTPLEAVTDSCSLPKNSKKPSVASVSLISRVFGKGTSLSHMLLPGPFRMTHSYFDNSVSISPTSVSHYKWMLSKHPSVHAKHQVNTFNHYRVSYLSVLFGGPEKTVYCSSTCHWSQGRSIGRWTGEQLTRLLHGSSSSGI